LVVVAAVQHQMLFPEAMALTALPSVKRQLVVAAAAVFWELLLEQGAMAGLVAAVRVNHQLPLTPVALELLNRETTAEMAMKTPVQTPITAAVVGVPVKQVKTPHHQIPVMEATALSYQLPEPRHITPEVVAVAPVMAPLLVPVVLEVVATVARITCSRASPGHQTQAVAAAAALST